MGKVRVSERIITRPYFPRLSYITGATPQQRQFHQRLAIVHHRITVVVIFACRSDVKPPEESIKPDVVYIM